jgi:hypothetical protein
MPCRCTVLHDRDDRGGVACRRSASPVVLSEFVTVDMSGQAVFEAGVLLWEMAFRRHPVDDSYPLMLDDSDYDVADTCVLRVEEAGAATAAGYPVDDFVRLVRDMVAMDASTRVSLSDARRRLELMLNPELVSIRAWPCCIGVAMRSQCVSLSCAGRASGSGAVTGVGGGGCTACCRSCRCCCTGRARCSGGCQRRRGRCARRCSSCHRCSRRHHR